MRYVLWTIALLVLIGASIFVIDLATTTGKSHLLGGTPVFENGKPPNLGARAIQLPTLAKQGIRRAAVLEKDYYFCHRQSGNVYRIPRTYQTDFASIPWIARLLVDRLGSTMEPSGIHDWLYSVGEGANTPQRESYRQNADRIFLDALKDNDVGLATRQIMYWAVRIGGRAAYARENEWNGRFRNPNTGALVTPPFAKPQTPVIANIDCSHFTEMLPILVGCFTTDPNMKLPPEESARYCDAKAITAASKR